MFFSLNIYIVNSEVHAHLFIRLSVDTFSFLGYKSTLKLLLWAIVQFKSVGSMHLKLTLSLEAAFNMTYFVCP